MLDAAMAPWGLTLMIVSGVVLAIAGIVVASDWKGAGHHLFQSSLDYLPSWYRRRGESVFRIWIGGGAAVFGLLIVVAGGVAVAH